MRQVYDEMSPITGNKSVLVEPDAEKKDNLKLCMESGYHTYELNWKVGSDAVEHLENTLPNIIVNSKFIDDDDQIWYKMILVTAFVILMPEPDENGDEVWALYALKDGDPTKDNIVMVVEGEDGHPIYRAIDEETRQVFPPNKFSLAMDAYQAVGASVNGAIQEMLKEREKSESE